MWQRGYTLKYFYQLMTERLHCQNLIPFNQNISILFILVHLFISSMIKQAISIGNDMRQRGNPFHTVSAARWPPGQPGPVWWLVTLTSPKVNAIVVSRSHLLSIPACHLRGHLKRLELVLLRAARGWAAGGRGWDGNNMYCPKYWQSTAADKTRQSINR